MTRARRTDTTGQRESGRTTLDEGLEQLPFFDFLGKLRRCADRFQLLLRLDRDGSRLDSVGADPVRQELPFQTLGKLAGLRDASVIDEAAPSDSLSNAEVTLRASEECAPVVACFRRLGVIVRWTTHHAHQLQKSNQARPVCLRVRTQDVPEELITFSFETRPIAWKAINLAVQTRLYMRTVNEHDEVYQECRSTTRKACRSLSSIGTVSSARLRSR